jgi:hypothetical protein
MFSLLGKVTSIKFPQLSDMVRNAAVAIWYCYGVCEEAAVSSGERSRAWRLMWTG